jgi:3-oxoadipate enol-lactonase
MASEVTTGFVPVPGGQLFYERTGEGAPIVFIHAAIADRRMWNREFEKYSTGATTIRFDVRGLGRSPPATAPYSDVSDLRALLDHLRVDRATLVGCSNGGRLAIDFTVENPARVKSLLLVAAGLSGWTPEMDPEGQPVYEQDMARSAKIPADWAAGREKEALAGLEAYWTSATTGANLGLVRTMMRENAHEIFTDSSARHNQPIEPPAAARLKSINVPTTILWGDRDEPTMAYICRRAAHGIPHARFVEVSGADHLINLSRPEAFDAALQPLL